MVGWSRHVFYVAEVCCTMQVMGTPTAFRAVHVDDDHARILDEVKICARADGCNEDHNEYNHVDCDGDGIADHVCLSTKVQKLWMILSTEGCPNFWGTYKRSRTECVPAFPELCFEERNKEFCRRDVQPPEKQEEEGGISILVIIILVCSALLVLACAYYVVNSMRDKEEENQAQDVEVSAMACKEEYVGVVKNNDAVQNANHADLWDHDTDLKDMHEGHRSLPQSKGHAAHHAHQHPNHHLDQQQDMWHEDHHAVPIDEHGALPKSSGHTVPSKHPQFGATDGLPSRCTPVQTARDLPKRKDGLPSRNTPGRDAAPSRHNENTTFVYKDELFHPEIEMPEHKEHHNHKKHHEPQDIIDHDHQEKKDHKDLHDQNGLHEHHEHHHHEHELPHDHHNVTGHNHHDHNDIYNDRAKEKAHDVDNLGGHHHHARKDV
eukprot:gnl/MRDRNA2_/MRDRNA2_85434_c0_seq2.p1 gnl/MRDRNA2_/MRDRNA2_85434_c0~~gnl/MRDRNA2_/MRDRNA2_85434_c0_seq2.p1  ORF type:complete len:434 (+),score=77.17 gnl/MRDRNA2_/MRDRNA2_85434_c0_seq2:74-1375(+)